MKHQVQLNVDQHKAEDLGLDFLSQITAFSILLSIPGAQSKLDLKCVLILRHSALATM